MEKTRTLGAARGVFASIEIFGATAATAAGTEALVERMVIVFSFSFSICRWDLIKAASIREGKGLAGKKESWSRKRKKG